MRPGLVDGLGLTLIVAASSLFLVHNGTRTFDFYDMSAFMDAGYRVLRGQRIYTDFTFIAGPLHPYLHAFFFALFGFGKTAVLAYLCASNALYVALTYLIGLKYLPRRLVVPLTAFGSIAFLGPTSHPWYDQTAYLFILLGLLATEYDRLPPAAEGLACGVAAALAFFTKANVGAAGGGVLLAALLLTRTRRERARALGAFFGGALAMGGLVLLSLHEPGEFFAQTMVAYAPAQRLTDFGKLGFELGHTLFVPLLALGVLILVFGGRSFAAAQRRPALLLLGLGASSIFTAWTGSMMVVANYPLLSLLLLYLVALWWRLPKMRAPRRWLLATLLAALVACSGDTVASTTHGLLTWSWRGQDLGSAGRGGYAFSSAALAGWHCPRFPCEAVDKAVAYLGEHAAPTDSLLVLPDSQIIYGLSGHESFRGAPFIFYRGSWPPPGKYYDDFVSRVREHPPEWLVLREQTRMDFFALAPLLVWLKLDSMVDERYDELWRYEDIRILRLKPSASSR